MRNECLIGYMRQIVSLTDQYITKRLKEEDLSLSSAHIPLFYILPQDGSPMLFNEIVEIWNKSKSTLSDIVTKYVESGLVQRCECADDKRNVYVSMTPKALQILDDLGNIGQEISGKLFEDLNEKDVESFYISVDKMLNNGRKML